jgi:hypothetical protein
MTHGALALAAPPPETETETEKASEPRLESVALAAVPDEVTPTPPPTSVVTLKAPPPPEAPLPRPSLAAPPAPPAPPAPSASMASAEPLVIFRVILGRVAETHPALASVFEHASVLGLAPERVVLGFPPESFAGAQAKEPEALEVITRVVRAHFGVATEVVIDLSARVAAGGTVAVAAAAERKQRTDKAKAAVAQHPLVVEALRVFKGELLEVRLREEEE